MTCGTQVVSCDFSSTRFPCFFSIDLGRGPSLRYEVILFACALRSLFLSNSVVSLLSLLVVSSNFPPRWVSEDGSGVTPFWSRLVST